MKRCPQCQADYFDQMLEFCLEDGAKLTVVAAPTATMTQPRAADQNSVETSVFDRQAGVPNTLEINDPATVSRKTNGETQPVSLKEKAVEKGFRALEIGTLVFALAHNWWQWLYVARQSHGSAADFLFSLEFLIWFLLLAAGTIFGLATLKLSRNKSFAYIGLLILAINFLLILVPRN